MARKHSVVIVLLWAVASVAALAAEPVELQSIAFPEKRSIDLPIVNRPAAPAARLEAEVIHRQGQAKIEISFTKMKPAILFGGDVTCYVVWAVTRDGNAENLGELLTPKPSGRLTFYSGQKNFALVVTAEAYNLVSRPSELLMFRNVAPAGQSNLASSFPFKGFVEAPEHYMDGISHLKWDSDVPLELLQARKAFDLAVEIGAQTHAAQIYGEAAEALSHANAIARQTSRGRELLDASRRAVALSNEALNISHHRLEAIRVEEELARRREETAALERRAAEAENAVAKAQRLTEQAREEARLARAERERTASETAALRTEKASLEMAMVQMRQEKNELQLESAQLFRDKSSLENEAALLRQEKVSLETLSRQLQADKAELEEESTELRESKEALEIEKTEQQRLAEKLRLEKEEIQGRLQSALSHVAETKDSARGFVVNLPDILFDVDEATLKHDAQLALAKLAGILLILPDQHVLIEGHTDSTGSAAHNLTLSQQRANAVLALLASQGLDRTRLEAIGFGMDRPMADNTTSEGRRRNRRVELVISASAQGVASK
ncbi:MAG: OmpA family protein [Acidobacteria bacterium]|nr:OmpA family protein [Acidobacteriota bacterium]NIM60346.1 OmpA family protein [Acidobacteriota bacterium]NIO60347.1 OmpA family protein [Acidobacteriota bacterium]NIQ31402.1 OmpA family protein [Acidobacteriota bacterium]NIQ86628.1 OmpA family protein [Acidobacteriota bacterium]